jgi:hypothetical protein
MRPSRALLRLRRRGVFALPGTRPITGILEQIFEYSVYEGSAEAEDGLDHSLLLLLGEVRTHR